MTRKQISLGYFIIFLLAAIISASEPYIPKIEDPIIEPWRWRHFSELDGKGVRCIEEDKNNIMWFGGDKGIVSYDGIEWKSYDLNDGISGLPVLCLKTLSDGRIFAGSARGISIRENDQWRSLFQDSILNTFTTNCIIELNDGSVLCATNHGLIHIQKSGYKLYTSKSDFEIFKNDIFIQSLVQVKETITINQTFSIAHLLQDKNGDIWIAVGYDNGQSGKILKTRLTSNGHLRKFVTFYREDPNSKFFNGNHLFETKSGVIWSIPEQFDQGLTFISKNEIYKKLLSKEFGGDNINTSIIQAKDGTIFLGAHGRFFTFINGKWKSYQSPNVPVPSSNRILFFEDSRGDIWLAGKQNEVFLLEYTIKNWGTYSELNYQDQMEDGAKWFIDIRGKVIKKENQNWTSYGEIDGLMSHPVRVYVSNYGEVWASGSHKGTACVAYLENDHWIKRLFPQLSWGMDTRSVFEDFAGALWFGCSIDILPEKGHLGGVIKFPDPKNNKENYIQYPLPQKEIGVYGIGQSKDNKLWIAGVSGCYFDGKQWQLTTNPKEFKYHTDYMYTGRDSILWVGSRNYGLFRFDGKEWTNYNIDNGLANNSITSIYAKSDSLVWVSTAKGISRYDGYSWSNNIFPPQLNIHKEGGEIRMDHDGSLWINKASRDWYRRALNKISYNKLQEIGFWTVFYYPDKLAPETKLVRYEKEVSPTGNTTISWSGNDPFSKTGVEQLQYSFKLDNNEWTAFSNQSNHFFSELKSGDHLLEVRARDMDFNIDPTPLQIKFTVLYPFYLRPAFFVPIILLTALSGLLLARVIKRGRELRQSKKETDNILKNIEQGLFLIDTTYKLSSQYSEFLKGVFDRDDLTNMSLIELLTEKVDQKIIDSIESFLDIMFQPEIDQQMLDDLNPLSEVEFKYKGNQISRFFSFRFRRIQIVTDENSDQHLIVVVHDVTERITLNKKLEEEKENADRKMNWLMSILHVEPGSLQEFLTGAENELLKISNILENPKILSDSQSSLQNIYRSMHMLKGNAGMLSMSAFAEQAHKYEDIISELQKNEKLTKKDIQNLQNELSNISASISDVHSLLDRISTIHNKMRTKRGYEKDQLFESLDNMIQQLAKDENKNVVLQKTNFELFNIPYKNQLLIREVLVQLVKNSIAHGIESTGDRKKLKKNKTGKIELSSFKNDQEFGIIIKDDGCGLQIDKLKSKVLEYGNFSKDQIDAWTNEELAMSIFLPGISTAEHINLTSGRGIGLDAVKEKVESAGGKISIDFKANRYCQFTIKFPVDKK